MEALAGLLPDGFGATPAVILIVASFFTSALTAAFGIGGGVAMLALMGLFMPVAALIPVHGAVQLGSNTGRAWFQRAHIRYDIAVPFVLGSLAGAIAGAWFVVQLPDAVLKLVLGLFIIAVTWASIPGFERLGRAGITLGSAVTALLTMFVGATGPLLASFFSKILPDDRKALIATHAAGMTVQHALKIVVFGFAGFAFATWLPLIAVMVVSGYLGTVYGSRMLERLPEETFRRWFRIGLTVLALDLLRQGIMALLAG
ncbi:TSUP family transporter [Chelativorans sp. ZYF759]|uniref:sulfite exporter TauE/SafE family protein n=1 Tax=Chelativorans sp. ZYF759 TaxID=2692213 RepID=UPI00145E667F|nr:sulfite exporter TauE/SafE family protein [Chelativorans sp. ZYF759]NMG41948.1 TSUP family transporter [Chelativorans sp. ZYF759]